MISVINFLEDEGYYIQLLTSRPDLNLKCKYQTYKWLDNAGIIYNNLAFASEKYIWVSKQKYYVSGNVKFAIDDSPKHALEYATHGVKVFMPNLSYNKNTRHENIILFDRENPSDLTKKILDV